ncbi:MAG: lipopolysaccharide heptosyltransferase II [Chlamydiales bacterium]|nr:lipopolysaccharide heptosyltransferase II [Chlamydiales bacterium]
MPNWLGDAVMATPLLAIARRRWPDAHIIVQTKKGLAPLYHGNPYINEVVHEAKRADIGILTTNSFSSSWEFFKARIKKRIGFRNECRFFLLTKALPFPKERGKEHLVTTYKRLLDAHEDDTPPQLFVTPQERTEAQKRLKSLNLDPHKKILGINAQAAYGPAKCWLPERFREVAQKAEHNVLFFGDNNGKEEIAEICKGLAVHNLAGKTTLRELIALIDACDLFLTNDSGPMHLAAALRTPLVALFGSTNEVATGPYQFGTVIHKHVSCSPCYLRTCPIDFRCMKQISTQEVLTALLIDEQ